MSIYTNDGDKISTEALCASFDYETDAQQIERGELFDFVYDLFGVYGKFLKMY